MNHRVVWKGGRATHRPLVVVDRFVLPSVLPSVGSSELPREGASREHGMISVRGSCVHVDGKKGRLPSKQSRFTEIVVHGNRHVGGGGLEKVDRAEPEGRASELEDDGWVSFEMTHVGVTCRSTTHDIDG